MNCSIAIFLIVTVGCKKDFTPQTTNPQPISITVENGVVAFKNSKSFEDAMNYFHYIGLEETHRLIRELPNFRGLIEITPSDWDDIARLNKVAWQLEDEQLGAMNFDDEIHPGENLIYDDFLIQDPFYEAILNTYREVMIDHLVIRNTENGVFAYETNGRQNFDAQYETPAFNQALTNIFTSDEMNGFQYMPIVLPGIYLINRDIKLFEENPIVIMSASCNGTKLKSNMFGQLQDCDSYLDNRRRIRATVWAQNLGLYSSIGMKTRRQTRFLRIWWNSNAERLSVEGQGYYSTKWLTNGITSIDYPYTKEFTRVDRTNVSNVSSPLPQSWHSAQIGIKFDPSTGTRKPAIKFTKKYEYKKHESDHAGWQNGTRINMKIKHN